MKTKNVSEADILAFDEARKEFLGSKRGLKTEFANFIWRSKHPLSGQPPFDYKEVLPLLLPAIKQQIEWRQKDGRFWKNFQTWINQRCWEEEAATTQDKPDKPLEQAVCIVDHKPATEYDLDDLGKPTYLCSDCIKAIGHRNWGIMPKSEIEKAVEEGKRRPSTAKDPELEVSDNKQKAIAKLTADLGDKMKG